MKGIDLPDVALLGLWIVDRAGDALEWARDFGRTFLCGVVGHRRVRYAGERFCVRCWRYL